MQKVCTWAVPFAATSHVGRSDVVMPLIPQILHGLAHIQEKTAAKSFTRAGPCMIRSAGCVRPQRPFMKFWVPENMQ